MSADQNNNCYMIMRLRTYSFHIRSTRTTELYGGAPACPARSLTQSNYILLQVFHISVSVLLLNIKFSFKLVQLFLCFLFQTVHLKKQITIKHNRKYKHSFLLSKESISSNSNRLKLHIAAVLQKH